MNDKYYLTENMKKYINSTNNKYKVGGGNLIVNRKIACSKTTREGVSRADTSDYICKEMNEETNINNKDVTSYRIRKLTERECWRLMGFSKINEDGSFDDTEFERAAKVTSKNNLYKQAGNSIVVKVLMHIFKEML